MAAEKSEKAARWEAELLERLRQELAKDRDRKPKDRQDDDSSAPGGV